QVVERGGDEAPVQAPWRALVGRAVDGPTARELAVGPEVQGRGERVAAAGDAAALEQGGVGATGHGRPALLPQRRQRLQTVGQLAGGVDQRVELVHAGALDVEQRDVLDRPLGLANDLVLAGAWPVLGRVVGAVDV